MDYINHWIPAFAGMTTGAIEVFRHSGRPRSSLLTDSRQQHFTVIPAKAEIQEDEAEGLMVARFFGRTRRVPLLWDVIPANAGMDYINHWIPAFAGMTTGAIAGFSSFRPAPFITFNGFPTTALYRHSSESWNPGGRGREVNGCRGLWEGALGSVPVNVIPTDAGMDYINHWIPAFAGMTTGAIAGFSSFRPAPFVTFKGFPTTALYRHSSESWNPGGRGRGVNDCRGLWAAALACRSCEWHSR